MKTRCSCCGSKNLRRCNSNDKDKFDEGSKLENIYECRDCGMTDVFEVEDWLNCPRSMQTNANARGR